VSIYTPESLPEHLRHGVVTIGNFDGVHRGHQALLALANRIKKQRPLGALTFSPHPVEFLYPHKNLFRLTSDQHKTQLLLENGADFVILQKLDKNFLNLSPKSFIKQILEDQLACEELVIGDDFRFGKNAHGSIADLAAQSFKLHVVPGYEINHVRCTSSAIRKYLSMADLKSAEAMLGRKFSLIGRVCSGLGLARNLGFNTANIIPPPNFALARGVYATYTRFLQNYYLSATNVGVKPSLGVESMLTVETHCLDQNLDLHDAELEIFFLEYIRKEKRFSSLETLQEQVHKDLNYIRSLAKAF
jgi:riboflavin kinase/FMN adenylyltransferase